MVSRGALGVWPPLSLHIYGRRPRRARPFPLDQPSCVLYGRARQGLFHGVRALGIAPGGEILVPAYHHGAEVEALEQAGATPRFYAGTADLAPDPSELEGMLRPATRALHLIHHLGFAQDSAQWADWCREHDLLLIEDCAPAWLSFTGDKPVGSYGDLAVFSLYKTIALPDTGATLCRAPLPAAAASRLGLGPIARRHAAWLAQRSDLLRALAQTLGRRRAFDPERAFAAGKLDAAPALVGRLLLPRLLDPEIARRRRENYGRLLGALAEHVPRPFSQLPKGAVPWVFPVASQAKPRLLESLAGDGISAMDLWSVPHPSLATTRFPDAARRRATTVALPVHQGLREHELERIVASVLRHFGG